MPVVVQKLFQPRVAGRFGLWHNLRHHRLGTALQEKQGRMNAQGAA
jgi:hypothetical protein